MALAQTTPSYARWMKVRKRVVAPLFIAYDRFIKTRQDSIGAKHTENSPKKHHFLTGASWHFLDVVWSAGSGYNDMHLLESPEGEEGDLIGVAFQMSTTWHNGEPEPKSYNGQQE